MGLRAQRGICAQLARAGCKKTLCLLHYPRKIKFIHSFILSFFLSRLPPLSLSPIHSSVPNFPQISVRSRLPRSLSITVKFKNVFIKVRLKNESAKVKLRNEFINVRLKNESTKVRPRNEFISQTQECVYQSQTQE